MGVGVLILEMTGGWLAGLSWRAAFLIYSIGVIILIGVLLTMREPVLPKFERNAAVPDEVFPTGPLVVGYTTRFFGSVLFFLMTITFPYFIATTDAARVMGENTALTSGLFLGVVGCAASVVGIVLAGFPGDSTGPCSSPSRSCASASATSASGWPRRSRSLRVR
jgi:MFS family permease